MEWTPTENPNSTIVPGKMRSDRQELPEGFTKEDADKAEIAEAKLQASASSRSRSTATTALGAAAPTDCMVYWPAWQYSVCGLIRVKYDSLGGPNSFLLWPTSNELTNPDGYGKRSVFTNGPIYWSSASGAHPVVNHFFAAWQRNGWEAGPLGYPTTDEIVNPDNLGRRQEFQNNAAIYWRLNEAWAVRGAIRDKWNTVNAERPDSLLGYPISDEKVLPGGQGRMNRFERGVIYWHPSFGAHPVSGPILDMWAEKGYEQSSYGYPTADQVSLGGNRVEQQFQGTKLSWPSLVDIADVTSIEISATETLSDGVPGPERIPLYDGTDSDPSAMRASPTASGQPSDCMTGGLKNIIRTLSCADYAGTIRRFEVRNGVRRETGKIEFTAKNWAVFTVSSSSPSKTNEPSWRLGTRIETTLTENSLADGRDYVFSSMCETSGNLCQTQSSTGADGTKRFALGRVDEAEWDQISTGPVTQGRDAVDPMKGNIGAKLLLGPVNPLSFEFNGLEARCDSVVRGAGCVNDKSLGAMIFSALRNPNVTEVAQHVFDAQGSLPSHWGTYSGERLSRTTVESRIKDNRDKACPNPPGLPWSCDEFPMATTNQGAALVADGDWSSRTVLKTANDSQGGIMSSSNDQMRLLDGDEYLVFAELADGRTSWG